MNFQAGIRRAVTSVALILIVALGARIAFAWNEGRKVPAGVLGIVPFQQETGNIAAALAEGRGFSDVFRTGTGPTAWLAPVYPLLVAAIFKICGVFTVRAFWAACSMNIALSSVACLPIFYAGKRLGGLAAGSVAAWFWAVFPNAVMMPFEWIWDTSLSALLAATILWATLALAESRRTRDWSVYGLLWGLTLMTNPALGVLLPFLLGWVVVRSEGRRQLRWTRGAVALGVTVWCCVPWTIRNYSEFRRFVPLRANLPFELWLGNNDIFDEHARSGRRVLTRMEEAQRYTKMGEAEYMDEKAREAVAFMESHPGLEVRLAGRKFLGFWLGTNAPIKSFVATNSWLIRLILFSALLTAVGAVAGAFLLSWRGTTGAFPAGVFLLVFPCLYYVTHADLRYRHPIDPVVLLLAAVAVTPKSVRRDHWDSPADESVGLGLESEQL